MFPAKIATVFGGSGFLGSVIVRHLADAGYIVRIATRTPAACYALRVHGTPGQIVPQFYDPARPDTIGAMINGSSVVVNCVGQLSERKRRKFHAAHTELPRQIAASCKRYHVARLVHISALGVDHSRAKYAHSKLAGEQAVLNAFPQATILRPSVIFGAGDGFFNLFARLAQFLPALPLIGGGRTKFQPVYVEDVAAAAMQAINTPAMAGQIYELGGPEVLTFRQIYDRLFETIGYRRALVPLPFWMARIQARVLQMLPTPPLTVDQVRLLQTDNVVAAGARTFADMGLAPTPMAAILPGYLAAYRIGGSFAEAARA